MPVVTMPDGANVAFPDDMPADQIKSMIADKFPNEVKAAQPKQSTGLLDAIKQTWDNPPAHPSLMRFAKETIEGFNAPRIALQGGFDPPLENPGVMTEQDAFRRNTARDAERRLGGQMAAGIQGGAAPGGIFGAPRGAFGMGFTRPGGAATAGATPVTPPSGVAAMAPEVVDAASRINVTVPRYLVDDRRMTQGMAAGLQNIPGAGDKIAKAAANTVSDLGVAANTVREGFGSGSATVAGSDAKDALASWITTGSKDIANRLYDKVDNLVNPSITTELKTTGNAAATISARRDNAKIPGESGAVNVVRDAVMAPGGLNYEGIKNLRSFIGEMTPQEMAGYGVKQAEAKQLYTALTADLRMAVLNAGGSQALTAFNKANRVFEQIAERRESLSKIVGAKGDAAPEAVFARLVAMAGNKTSADISKLAQARKAMGPEAWNEVASAVVARLGRDPQGEFSIKRFLGPNGYSGLSDPAKNILFKSTGREPLARSLDDIAFVTKQIEDKLNQFYNPSGTAKSVVSTGLVLGVLHSPIKTLSTIIGGNNIAKVLSEPATAQAAADWAKAYHATLVAPHLASRSRTVREAAEKLAELVSRQTGQSQQTIFTQMMAGATGTAGPSAAATAP